MRSWKAFLEQGIIRTKASKAEAFVIREGYPRQGEEQELRLGGREVRARWDCLPPPPTACQDAQKYTEPSLSPWLSNFWICALRCLSLPFR